MQCTQQPDVEDFKVSKGVQYQVKKNLDIKFRYFEKATKFEKKLPPCFEVTQLLKNKLGNFCGLFRISEL